MRVADFRYVRLVANEPRCQSVKEGGFSAAVASNVIVGLFCREAFRSENHRANRFFE